MSAHTPGPWTIKEGMSGRYYLLHDADAIADCQYHPENARLMSAAPDLLAALREFMAASTATDIRAAQSKARAAIAKAEGKS
jgi:hypothetical protein